jgi:hypothetical protein
MVGHSESLSGIKHSLKLIQPAIYLKPTGTESGAQQANN